MAYSDQAQLSNDNDFVMRLAACAAVELDFAPGGDQPTGWAANNVWLIAASPGFADAYATAVLNGVPRPGNDPGVITDAMILAAVQALPPAS